MLSTQDLLSEADVLAFDNEVLTVFGASAAAVRTNLNGKRLIAVQDWLHGELLRAGYRPEQHTARYPSASVLHLTGSTYADITTAASDKTIDDLALPTLLASSTDRLLVSSTRPFKGLVVGMLDTVNSLTSSAIVEYWSGGQWLALSLTDATQVVTGKSFSGGGRITWTIPDDWAKRPVNAESTWRYWVRLGVTVSPNAGTATHLLPLLRSRLTTPAAHYALSLLYGESWGIQRGEWKDKAAEYQKMADRLLLSALKDLQEFDTTGAEAVSTVEEPAEPDPNLTTWERG